MKAGRARCKTTGKYRYPTFDIAVHAALVSTGRRGTALRPYVCPDCTDWHLTKRPANPHPTTIPGPFTPSDLARIVANRKQESA